MKKPNKQHDARAASFKRIAKDIRLQARSEENISYASKRDLLLIARAIENEGKHLGSMR